ncbi:hypothetical protein ILUMI_02590, partial [Ignelater luminosus]
KGRSTSDQLFTVRPIMKKAWEFNTPLYQVFIDFKQAYDSIQRKPLYSEMKEIVIPDKLIRLTRITIEDAKETVEIQLHPSEDLEIKQSLRQGNGLAPLREGYEELEQKSTKIRLEINGSKTKAMEIKKGARLDQNWTVDNDNIEPVQEEQLKYQ